MKDRYVKRSSDLKVLYFDGHDLHSWSIIQPLPNKDIFQNLLMSLKEIFETDDCPETGYLVEVDIP